MTIVLPLLLLLAALPAILNWQPKGIDWRSFDAAGPQYAEVKDDPIAWPPEALMPPGKYHVESNRSGYWAPNVYYKSGEGSATHLHMFSGSDVSAPDSDLAGK